jgi:hypothetical protein
MARSADAAPVTLVLSGTVAEVEENGLALGGGIATGTPWTITTTFDPELGVDAEAAPTYAEWILATPPGQMRLEIGSYVFESATTFSVIVSDGVDDSVDFRMENPDALGDPPPVDADLSIVQAALFSSADVITSDAIPIGALDPSLWEVTEFVLDFSAPDLRSSLAIGAIDSIEVVPEPSTLLLALPALGLLAARTRTRPHIRSR